MGARHDATSQSIPIIRVYVTWSVCISHHRYAYSLSRFITTSLHHVSCAHQVCLSMSVYVSSCVTYDTSANVHVGVIDIKLRVDTQKQDTIHQKTLSIQRLNLSKESHHQKTLSIKRHYTIHQKTPSLKRHYLSKDSIYDGHMEDRCILTSMVSAHTSLPLHSSHVLCPMTIPKPCLSTWRVWCVCVHGNGVCVYKAGGYGDKCKT